MAVVDLDQLHIDLDQIAVVVERPDLGDEDRARRLSPLWLGVYSTARDRGLRDLAALAASEFWHWHLKIPGASRTVT